MIPQKVALVSFSDQLGHYVRKSLHRADQLQIFPSIEGTEQCSMVLLHHHPPVQSCLEWIPILKRQRPERPIIVIGDTSSPYDVAEAFRLGAREFVFKPLSESLFRNVLFRFRLEFEAKQNLRPMHRMQLWFKKLINSWFYKKPIVSAAFQEPFAVDESLSPRPELEVQFFKNLTLTFKGKQLPDLPGRRAKSLLAYLLYHYPKPVHREVLMEKFWGDSLPSSARNCLNVTLCSIRRYFETYIKADKGGRKPEIIVHENGCYRIGKNIRVERDIDFFENYWKRGQQIEQAKGMETAMNIYHQAFAFYRGEFLEDLRFEEWAGSVRERTRELWIVILDRLSNHFFTDKKYQISLNLSERMLEKDACLEDVHRRIMQCHYKMGMRDRALRQFLKCKDILQKELGLNPGKSTWDLYLEIRDA